MDSSPQMSGDEHQAALERARDSWNRGDLSGYLQLYDPEVVLHGYAGVEPGLQSVQRFSEEFWSAFPGSQLVVQDIISAGDKLVCRFVIQATHAGPFQGLPATGKAIVMPGITILRFRSADASNVGARRTLLACSCSLALSGVEVKTDDDRSDGRGAATYRD